MMIAKRGIFVQTFIWFWLVMSAFALIFLAIHVLTAHGLLGMSSWERYVQEEARMPLAVFGQVAVEYYEQKGVEGLNGVIGRLRSSAVTDIYLFNEKGSELTGRTVPPDALALSLSIRPGKNGEVAAAPVDNEWGFAALRLNGARGRSYVIVGVVSENERHETIREVLSWVIGTVVVLVLSSGACYFLSRYMTTPIIKLIGAARRMASGDLTVRVAPVVGARRDEIGELAADFDILAERVESLLTSQRQLLANISHELRSPLSRLGVALDLAGRHSPPEVGRYLGRIELEAERLNELIGGLLAFTRLETGVQDAKRESFDLADVVREVAADADFEARAAGRAVRITESAACVVVGVKELIHSALENVTRNAVRYTGEGTGVDIAIQCTDNTAAITIRDHGPGVPEDDIGKIFRPFYRVEAGRERQTGGIGLGLAITERAIQFNGGTVKAFNAADGGLIIEITIPRDKTGVSASST